MFIEPSVGHCDVAPVPAAPVVGLVARHQEDRMPLRVKREQDLLVHVSVITRCELFAVLERNNGSSNLAGME